ncbi:unnamed protein product [Rodentolepis nana]|uniref:Reelin domain-containing protein n=1 Tax=Rodentolepis nana TaxID=102285 RepID=A0A0R3TGM3_RODNA|nr:unnamed protein product [Rodentolepis nana]
MKDSRMLLNFGGSNSLPLRYPPSSVAGGFQLLAEVTEDAQVANSNCGWRLNPYDATAGVEVQPDGMALQAHWGSGWQGCRANRCKCNWAALCCLNSWCSCLCAVLLTSASPHNVRVFHVSESVPQFQTSICLISIGPVT